MDLSTQYLGLTLRSPLVASASPMTSTPRGIARLEAAGVGAVVLPSLFEEQLRTEAERDYRLAEAYTGSHGEALTYLPRPAGPSPIESIPAGLDPGEDGPSRYLGLIERRSEERRVG